MRRLLRRLRRRRAVSDDTVHVRIEVDNSGVIAAIDHFEREIEAFKRSMCARPTRPSGVS